MCRDIKTSCLFMDAPLYADIRISTKDFRAIFECKIPDGHQFMQDNDPKHTSRLAKVYFLDTGINQWWKTPPESPDLNPIEKPWHELKGFIRQEVQPTTKAGVD